MKFVIIHHSACTAGALHFVIGGDGQVLQLLPEQERGMHPSSVGIGLEGDCDQQVPSEAQLVALRELLVHLKVRFGDLQLGGHSQVRGDETTCPGTHFPLSALRQWAQNDWEAARDAFITRSVESQYSN